MFRMGQTPQRTYRGQSVFDRRADRRERFIEAALSEFGTRSYARTTISHLCAAAGLSRRQFYEEFTDREALLLVPYDRIQDDAQTAVAAALGDVTGAESADLVTAGVLAYARSIGENPLRAGCHLQIPDSRLDEAIDRGQSTGSMRSGSLIDCEPATIAAPATESAVHHIRGCVGPSHTYLTSAIDMRMLTSRTSLSSVH